MSDWSLSGVVRVPVEGQSSYIHFRPIPAYQAPSALVRGRLIHRHPRPGVPLRSTPGYQYFAATRLNPGVEFISTLAHQHISTFFTFSSQSSLRWVKVTTPLSSHCIGFLSDLRAVLSLSLFVVTKRFQKRPDKRNSLRLAASLRQPFVSMEGFVLRFALFD